MEFYGSVVRPVSGGTDMPLMGEVIGFDTGWRNNGRTGSAAAFDGNKYTGYDPYEVGNGWCGLKLDGLYILDKIAVLTREWEPERLKGAEIQGSDDGEHWYTIYHFNEAAVSGSEYTIVSLDDSNHGNYGYSMYRYINKEEHGSVAEVELFGHQMGTVSGQCGENAVWTFDASNGRLTISGNGNMYDYNDWGEEKMPPWDRYRKSIKEFYVGKDITYIGTDVFNDTEHLETIIVEDGNVSYKLIDGVLFTADDKRLVRYPVSKTDTTYTIPSSVEEADNWAFAYNKHIETVVLPNGMTQISRWMFVSCEGLVNINFDYIKEVKAFSFMGCHGLISVELPVAESIGMAGFCGCANLKNVRLPEVTYLEDAFKECNSLKIVSTKILENTDYVYIPKMNYISCNAFEECRALETIDIPNVLYIDAYAFKECTALTSISAPDLIAVGWDSFNTCTSLKTVDLPKATYLNAGSFSHCHALESVNIPNVIEIEFCAFDECWALSSINLPGGEDYKNFNIEEKFVLNSSNMTAEMFYTENIGNLSKENGVIKGSSTSYDPYIIYNDGNFNLKAEEIQEIHIRVKSYSENRDFQFFFSTSDNDGFNEGASFRNKTNGIGEWTDIIIYTRTCLAWSGIITNFRIDPSVEAGDFEIESIVFYSTSDGLRKIGYGAFKNCGLTTIDIPASVDVIEREAFIGCNKLERARFYGNVPGLFEGGVFANTAENFTIIYTDGKSGWSTPTWTSPAYDVYNAIPSGEEPPVGDTPTFVVSSTSGYIGSEVRVTVAMKNNPGLNAIQFKLNYDSSRLELIDSINHVAVVDVNKGSDITKIPYTVFWNSAEERINGDIDLITFVFKIKDNAPLGDAYVNITYDKGNVIQDENDIYFAITNGNVNVTNLMIGDVNSDGNINQKDLLLLRRYLLGWNVEISIEAARAIYPDNDTEPNYKDVLRLCQYLVGDYTGELGA